MEPFCRLKRLRNARLRCKRECQEWPTVPQVTEMRVVDERRFAMTVTPSPTPTTPESPAVIAATTADAIAAELRTIVGTLQTAVPGLLKFDARQVRRIAASAKFGNDSLAPTINVVSAVPRAKDRNMFDVHAGQLALQYRDQL